MNVLGQLERSQGIFGKPRPVGHFCPIAPISTDLLGEVWAGFIKEGREAGRLVLLTITRHGSQSPVLHPILRSAQEAVHMRHPNLLAFLDVAVEGDAAALASEYLEGEPLSRMQGASAPPMSPKVALAIVQRAALTLSDLRERHPHSFSHGALCPETMFVARFGEVLLKQPAVHCAAVHISGLRAHPTTLPYLAPEYLIDNRENEESADVFAAGVILWELIAGRPLFGQKGHSRQGPLTNLSGSQVLETERRIGSLKIPSLSQMDCPNGALHPDVVRLVDWALERSPSRRPQTLADFSRAISSLSSQLVAETAEVARAVETLAGKTLRARAELLQRPNAVKKYSLSPPKRRPQGLGTGGEGTGIGRIPIQRRAAPPSQPFTKTPPPSKPFMETPPLSEPFVEESQLAEPFVETPRTLSEPPLMSPADLPSVVPAPIQDNLFELDPPETGMELFPENSLRPKQSPPAFAERTPVSIYGERGVAAALPLSSRPANDGEWRTWLLAAAALLLGAGLATTLLHHNEQQRSPSASAETTPQERDTKPPAESASDQMSRGQESAPKRDLPSGAADKTLDARNGQPAAEAAPVQTAAPRRRPERKPVAPARAEGPYRPPGI